MSSGVPNLAETHPEVAAQWHPTRNGRWTPEQTAPGASSYRVWWQCEAGHEFEETPAQRTSVGPKWKGGKPTTCKQCVAPGKVLLSHRCSQCGTEGKVLARTLKRGETRCFYCRTEDQL